MPDNILYLKNKLRLSVEDALRCKEAIGPILELDENRPYYPAWLTIEAILAAHVLLDGGRSFAVAIRCARYVLAEVRAEHDRRITALLDLVSKKGTYKWTGTGWRHYGSHHEAMRRARKTIDLGGAINDVLAAAANP